MYHLIKTSAGSRCEEEISKFTLYERQQIVCILHLCWMYIFIRLESRRNGKKQLSLIWNLRGNWKKEKRGPDSEQSQRSFLKKQLSYPFVLFLQFTSPEPQFTASSLCFIIPITTPLLTSPSNSNCMVSRFAILNYSFFFFLLNSNLECAYRSFVKQTKII